MRERLIETHHSNSLVYAGRVSCQAIRYRHFSRHVQDDAHGGTCMEARIHESTSSTSLYPSSSMTSGGGTGLVRDVERARVFSFCAS